MFVAEKQEHLRRTQHLLDGGARPIARPEFTDDEDRRVKQRHASARV